VRPPAQDRSQRTLERLLDATERLLDQRPFDRISVQDIVAEADASVGAFYGRFPSKDAVLHALHERYVAEGQATNAQALSPATWDGVPLPDVIRGLCAFVVAFLRQHPGLRRALVLALADPVFRARSAALASDVVDRVAALLEARRAEHAHPDPAVAADVAHRILFSLADQHALYGAESPTGHPLSDDTLVAETTRAIVGYLGVHPPEAR
jgi:AcrR family transcriptional regulator